MGIMYTPLSRISKAWPSESSQEIELGDCHGGKWWKRHVRQHIFAFCPVKHLSGTLSKRLWINLQRRRFGMEEESRTWIWPEAWRQATPQPLLDQAMAGTRGQMTQAPVILNQLVRSTDTENPNGYEGCHCFPFCYYESWWRIITQQWSLIFRRSGASDSQPRASKGP